MHKITTRNREVLNEIVKFHSENGYMPSYQDIGRLTNLKSMSSVNEHVIRLSDFIGFGRSKSTFLITYNFENKCVLCDADINDDMRFCPQCGAFIGK